MSTCPIRVERITKRYGKTIGVSDISLDFPTGHVVCIVGESGSGKTTLINVLLGLIKPTAGRVFPAQQAALVLQDPYTSLSPLLTIEQSMAEPFKLAKKRIDAHRIDSVFSRLGLNFSALAQRRPHELSGGQLQRINIARAVLMQPDLIVMDEPTSMVDPINTQRIGEIIAEMKHDAAVVVVTHDLAFAQGIADSTVVMRQGKMIEYITANNDLTTSQLPYVREMDCAANDLAAYVRHLNMSR